MANNTYDINPRLTIDDVTTWENTGRASVIKEFYNDEALYEEQSRRITAETKENVRRLMEIADVYFITAVSPRFMGVRAKQICEAFPELACDRIILGAAKHLVQFDIVLDDNFCNVLNSPAKFPVLYRKPWNRNMTGLLSVNSMSEFVFLVEHIIGVKKREDLSSNRVIALVGSSGSGKNKVAEELCRYDNYERPVSYSTEKNSTSHICITEDDFRNESFFEKTVYAGNCYGTKKEDIEKILKSGKNAVIPLDICGAIAMKQNFPTTIVFLKRNKIDLIKNIIGRDFSEDEKTLRIISLEVEKKNQEICDISIDSSDVELAVKKIIKL